MSMKLLRMDVWTSAFQDACKHGEVIDRNRFEVLKDMKLIGALPGSKS